MNDTTNAVAERQLTPIAEVRLQLENLQGQFAAALPAHIPVERFGRVVMTAIQNNPDLVMKCDRRSLWNSCMKAAQDGLLPDGREGAIVAYGSQAQWMPMIAGLRKKVRNSGEIATWDAQVVHEKDKFKFQLGDDPFIHHEPCLDGDPGKVIAAYSIAVLKSGEKAREVMTVSQIEKVRSRSKAARNGPWVTDYEEMCRKTVARRHSKTLPMSTDLDDLIRRDDSLYDLEGAREEAANLNGGRPQTLAGKLDVLAQMPSATENGAQAASPGGEVAEQGGASPAAPASPQTAGQPLAANAEAAPETQGSPADASSGAAEGAWPADRMPANAGEYVAYAKSWIAQVRTGDITHDDATKRWKGELKLRNGCGVDEEARDPLKAELDAAIADAKKAA
jgi:recombination protein RecT